MVFLDNVSFVGPAIIGFSLLPALFIRSARRDAAFLESLPRYPEIEGGNNV